MVNGEISFKTYNTRRNLPVHTGRRRGEANFLGAFLRSYADQADPECCYGRHFAVPECGVADFIVFQFDDAGQNLAMQNLVAFEVKLSDWRRALSQAYRYRYYADSAVVILPAEAAKPAKERQDLFEQFSIGLWTFDRRSGLINKAIPSTSLAPISEKKREQALFRIQRCSIQLRKFRENAQALING